MQLAESLVVRLPRLYAWQQEAFDEWTARGSRGVIEAVTGAGKTVVAHAAIASALGEGRRVLVVVPTKELQAQWMRGLRQVFPGAGIGGLGGDHRASLRTHDVVVGIVNSLTLRDAGLYSRRGLLVADEVHRYGSPVFSTALDDRFDQRLGLTATYERSDEGVEEHLKPFFGPVCYSLGYQRALHDDVLAHFRIGLVGVELPIGELIDYRESGKVMAESRERLVEAEPPWIWRRL